MDSDELLRAAAQKQTDLANNEAKRLDALLNQREPDLYSLLAARITEPVAGSAAANDRFRGRIDLDELDRSTAAVELGKRIFARWSRALHDFLCSPSTEDKNLRDDMLQAIFSKQGGGVAIIAGGLVATFGASPAIAAVVAALLVKLIMAPAVDEVCKAWAETLGPTPKTSQ
jgi:hypothetical protein